MMNAHLCQSLGFKTKCGLIVAWQRGGNTPFNRYADSVSRLCRAVCYGCLSVGCWWWLRFSGWHVPKFGIEKVMRFKTGLDFGGIYPINKLIATASNAALPPGRRPLRFDWQCHIRKRVMNHKTRVKGKLTQQLTGDWYIELEVFNLAAELTQSLYNKLQCLRGNISPDGSLCSAFSPSPRLPMRGW